jgi:CHASE3 domain sensor protein
MIRHWTFGQKVGAAFGLTVALSVAIGVVALYTLRGVVEAKDRVISVNAQLLIVGQKLYASVERKASSGRGFLLTRENRFVSEMNDARAEFTTALGKLKQNSGSEEERRWLAAIERSEAEHQQGYEQVIALRRTETPIDVVIRTFDANAPKRARLDDDIRSFVSGEELLLDRARLASTATASRSMTLVVVIAGAVLLVGSLAAFVLTRTLGRQIGTAVGQVQSSSAELQAAATQQATGSKQQSTAMSEISTTISELLATSRQINESAQRVAQFAEQTAAGARAGYETVETAHESIAGIRRQVDLVVSHMLELGKTSQQIGSVLEIVSELAEQTNILAINATIEAAGAGESGKRFAVVAEEIRKLADRVAGSTKEIRGLIEDVRSAVNTTVMATETGSKAVDAGSKQFGHVTVSFKQIADLVVSTTEAAREIELSTKQQMSAVEQVNVAIRNVTQASKETEASSGQTQQTASQLAFLSKDLLRLVQPQAA